MRYGSMIFLAAALVAGSFAAYAKEWTPGHARPGVFGDMAFPPAVEAPPGQKKTYTRRLIERCSNFLDTVRIRKDGTIRTYRHDYENGFCLGWTNAAFAFMNFRDSSGNEMLGVCLPDDMTTKRIIETFLDYVKRHDDDIQYNPSFLIYWALLEKYPCQ